MLWWIVPGFWTGEKKRLLMIEISVFIGVTLLARESEKQNHVI